MTSDSPFKVVSDTPQCGNCVYYFNPSDVEIGLCRRYPPTPFMVGTQTLMGGQTQAVFQSQYPGIYEHGFCGEHVKRPSVEQAAPATGLSLPADFYRFRVDAFRADTWRALNEAQHLVETVVGPGSESPAVDPGGGGEDGS